jgi:diadenosine tetraphosphate (Ap4A) HIT family hydrolase
MDLIDTANARSKEQEEVMNRIKQDEVCPFCEENLATYHKKPIMRTGDYWVLTENQWPYAGAKTHLFAIARKHITSLDEISRDAAAELFELFQEGMREKNIPGGTFAMRFGGVKPGYASSVSHLHAHLIEPDLDDPEHPGIKFPMSKAAKKSSGA